MYSCHAIFAKDEVQVIVEQSPDAGEKDKERVRAYYKLPHILQRASHAHYLEMFRVLERSFGCRVQPWSSCHCCSTSSGTLEMKYPT